MDKILLYTTACFCLCLIGFGYQAYLLTHAQIHQCANKLELGDPQTKTRGPLNPICKEYEELIDPAKYGCDEHAHGQSLVECLLLVSFKRKIPFLKLIQEGAGFDDDWSHEKHFQMFFTVPHNQQRKHEIVSRLVTVTDKGVCWTVNADTNTTHVYNISPNGTRLSVVDVNGFNPWSMKKYHSIDIVQTPQHFADMKRRAQERGRHGHKPSIWFGASSPLIMPG